MDLHPYWVCRKDSVLNVHGRVWIETSVEYFGGVWIVQNPCLACREEFGLWPLFSVQAADVQVELCRCIYPYLLILQMDPMLSVHLLCSLWDRLIDCSNDSSLFFIIPPPFLVWGYTGITLSICLSVRFCQIISPELPHRFEPNLVLWCIIRSQIVSQKKNWFPIVNVKVTVRAYIIKIWLFLLYLPNCWSGCNQTRFGSTTL